MHKTTMMSFAITLSDQCCRRHLVGLRVVSDIRVIRSCRSICSPHSESNNTNQLLRLLTAVPGTSILLYITDISWPTTWRRVLGDHGQIIQWRYCTLSIGECWVLSIYLPVC